tara:strand:+ start:1556 stop:1858 length:303 start_codon:yes stop_codon:yes gene_type:complete
VFIKPESLDKVIVQSKKFFEEEVKDTVGYEYEEQHSEGYEIDGHLLDINIWDGDSINGGDGMWHCEAIECHYDENGTWVRGYQYQNLWSVKKGEVDAKFV